MLKKYGPEYFPEAYEAFYLPSAPTKESSIFPFFQFYLFWGSQDAFVGLHESYVHLTPKTCTHTLLDKINKL
ncbi:UNVERIFIED_CONTAM: hypothetical protein NCL1_47513 [Trichonephila clavipes]